MDLPQLYAAIDTKDMDRAIQLARDIVPHFGGIKLGLEFFMRHGQSGIQTVMSSVETVKPSLFLDLKLHDIPNTVQGALTSVLDLNPDYLTVHALGGAAMLRSCAEVTRDTQTRILGVTVLTSLSQEDVSTYSQSSVRDIVLKLTDTVIRSGCAGVICSPHEVKILRQEYGDDIVLMVPGIRLSQGDHADQKRVATPAQALADGASHLVIGRAVTSADNPGQAAKALVDSLGHDYKAA